MQSSEADRAAIAQPLPGSRVFFAGEHCAVGRCMVAQAAIETGAQAALQCVAAMRGLTALPKSNFFPPVAKSAESGASGNASAATVSAVPTASAAPSALRSKL
jgi:hypothetical protein